MLTRKIKFAIITTVIGLAAFLFTNLALSKVERLHRLPDNDLNSAFFIGEDMRICSIESCNNKHFCKGLCDKHYNKQYYQNNKEKIYKQQKQYRKK